MHLKHALKSNENPLTMLKNVSVFPYSLIFHPIAPLSSTSLTACFLQPPSSHLAASFLRPGPVSPYLHALLSRDAHAHVCYLDHADIIGPITWD